ncbi:hypothetical protein JW916_08275 [Candidatus Sumerlaeota bacterium]|nr:hypothetical protein [Candidatus Sumerlaeota bacterium]
MIDELHPLPPAARRSRRVWLLWLMGGLALFVCVLAVVAFVYRTELVALGQTSMAIRAGAAFVDTAAPALRRDFPFDPESPPAFDADLFGRYCAARQVIATRGRTVFEATKELGRARPEMSRDRMAILREIGPLARDARGLFDEVEKTLRRNRLNVEAYRWTAIQTWGHVALAARRGDSAASSVMALLRSEFGANIPELARAQNPSRVGEILLARLGERFETASATGAWGVIREGWTAWSTGAPACAADFAVMEFWDDFVREMRGISKK